MAKQRCLSIGRIVFFPKKRKNVAKRLGFECQAVIDEYPQHCLVNKPKKPVVDPQREWLKSVLKHWVTEIIESKKFNERGIFDSKEVIKEYSNYCNHEKNLNSFHIWQWISIEMWFRKFIDN